MILKCYSYRLAEEVLESPTYRSEWQEVKDILGRLQPILHKKKNKNHPVSAASMNNWLDEEFKARNWDYHPRIVKDSELEGDYRKKRIQLEVQFGNMARWTYDILKFQICYSQDIIDIGVLVVPMQAFSKRVGDNIAYFERVCRELPHAKLSITLPIMVVGITPEDLHKSN